MSAFLHNMGADTALVLAEDLGGAEDVTLQADDVSGPVALRAFFEAAGVEPRPGGSLAPVISVAPTLHVPLQAVTHALGRSLRYRDHVLVRGTRYRVQAVQDDGYGFLACKLLESPEPDGGGNG